MFTLDPRRPRLDDIEIADTCGDPCYESGVETAESRRALPRGRDRRIVRRVGARDGATFSYGWFTFTNEHGTFKGYATPDFRKFAIRITFDR